MYAVSWSISWRLHATRIGEAVLLDAVRAACDAMGVERFECRPEPADAASFACWVWLPEPVLRRLEDGDGLELIDAHGGVPSEGLIGEIAVTHVPEDQWGAEHSVLGVDSGRGANRGCWYTTTAIAQRIAQRLGADDPT